MPSLVEIGQVVCENENVKGKQTDGRCTTGDQKSSLRLNFSLRGPKPLKDFQSLNFFNVWSICLCFFKNETFVQTFSMNVHIFFRR